MGIKPKKRLIFFVNPIKLNFANKRFYGKKRKRNENNTNSKQETKKKVNNQFSGSVSIGSGSSNSSRKSEEEENNRGVKKMKMDNNWKSMMKCSGSKVEDVDSVVVVGGSSSTKSEEEEYIGGVKKMDNNWKPMMKCGGSRVENKGSGGHVDSVVVVGSSSSTKSEEEENIGGVKKMKMDNNWAMIKCSGSKVEDKRSGGRVDSEVIVGSSSKSEEEENIRGVMKMDSNWKPMMKCSGRKVEDKPSSGRVDSEVIVGSSSKSEEEENIRGVMKMKMDSNWKPMMKCSGRKVEDKGSGGDVDSVVVVGSSSKSEEEENIRGVMKMKMDSNWKPMMKCSGRKVEDKRSSGHVDSEVVVGGSSSTKSEEEENNRGVWKMKMKMDTNWKPMMKCSGRKVEDKRNGGHVDSEVVIGGSSNSNNIFDINRIFLEVLSRLPMKSLMRFKCVSKHWQFSISQDQGLIDLHFSRSKQTCPDFFIVVPRHTEVDILQRTMHNSGFKSSTMYGGVREYRYQQSILLGNLFGSGTAPPISSIVRRLEQSAFYYTEILKPVNGLICFVNRCQAAVCILNPSTRESTSWISSSLRTDKKYNFSKEYERGAWLPTYFFGFDPATKTHKVVCTWMVREPVDIYKPVGLGDGIRRTNICEVLTVGENNWRRIEAEVPFSYRVKSSLYANGFIYWGDQSMGIPEFLNSFDVASEKFKVTRVPKEIREKCMNPQVHIHARVSGLIEVGGKIALSQQWAGNVVKLWICSDDASMGSYISWTEMTLELPFQWGNSRSAFFHGVAGADRIIIESNPSSCRADIKKASLYSYDLEKKTSTVKVKSGVVSKLVSDSLFSKLESVSLFSSFAESLWPVRKHPNLWPVRKHRFRHNQDIEEVRLRLNLDVTVARDSAPAPAPVESFTDLCLHESIMKDIAFHEYTGPTSIQAQVMPVALNGRDLLGCAETGSGKTAAFAIPMIQHCLAQPSVQRRQGDGPLALVLSPTREHAQQIEKEVKAFSRSLESFRTAIAVGGTNMAEQRSELRAGVNIVVATPGSFLDHLQQGNTCLSRISFVVLDEADRMLDMGFEPQIREVMRNLPAKHQTLVFSATLPVELEALVQEYLTDPVQVIVGRARRVRSSRRKIVP
ncbi:hypothetical protein MKW92_037910 [Papaver armeniacum]|nr:hypothetical protein MKW92_037910 [Papaver armeniacum]